MLTAQAQKLSLQNLPITYTSFLSGFVRILTSCDPVDLDTNAMPAILGFLASMSMNRSLYPEKV